MPRRSRPPELVCPCAPSFPLAAWAREAGPDRRRGYEVPTGFLGSLLTVRMHILHTGRMSRKTVEVGDSESVS